MKGHLRVLGRIIMVLACGTVAVLMNTGRLFGPANTPDKHRGDAGPKPTPTVAEKAEPATGRGRTLRLVWSDESGGAAGSPPDVRHWKTETGRVGHGRLDYATPQNVALDGKGHVVITARRQRVGTAGYSSARITTEGRFQPTYGRITARIKTPDGRGLWPAFWMLGTNFRQHPWPDCGEIDIMERRGHLRDRSDATLQGPGYSGTGLTRAYTLGPGGDFGAAFHVFSVDWTSRRITFRVDGHVVQTAERGAVPGRWAFDHPFFIILNLAVGGGYAGRPDGTAGFPAQMVVDYVRAYRFPSAGAGAAVSPAAG